MTKTKLFRALLCAGISGYLLLLPWWLPAGKQTDFFTALWQPKKTIKLESITLYHIASHRTYQGSVTEFLKEQAQAFEKRHRGVHIEVEGMGYAAFLERVEHGRAPDAYSFFGGDLYREQLGAYDLTIPELRSGLYADACAVPYLFSGYVLCRNGASASASLAELTGACDLASDSLNAARLCFDHVLPQEQFLSGECHSAVLDLRAAGDLLRDGALTQLTAEPLDAFTDLVCYLGLARDVDPEKIQWLEAFFLFMLSEEVQQELTCLGAFSALGACRQAFSSRMLDAVNAAYSEPVTPNPFLWQANREQLLADAALAVCGDAYAKTRFFDRFSVVLAADG